MSNFLHFSNGDGTIINTNHLVCLYCQTEVATEKDAKEDKGFFAEGQDMYCMYIVLSQGMKKLLKYSSKEKRDIAYNEILAALHPIQIGKNPSIAANQ
jgi:hypothetical protein